MSNKRQELISLAIDSISSKGFDSFSYADLSKKLNIAKASIHHYFPKKEDLGLEVLDYMDVNTTDFFEEILSKHTSAIKRFEYLFSKMRMYYCDQKCICPIFTLQGEWEVIPETMHQRLKKIVEKEIAFVSEILKDGLSKNEITFSETPDNKAAEIVSAYKGALQYSRSMGITFFDQVTKNILINLEE